MNDISSNSMYSASYTSEVSTYIWHNSDILAIFYFGCIFFLLFYIAIDFIRDNNRN